MKPTVFAIFILASLFGISNVYHGIRFHFIGTEELQARVESLRETLEKQKTENLFQALKKLVLP